MAIPKSTANLALPLLGAAAVALLLHGCGPDERPTSPHAAHMDPLSLTRQRVKPQFIDMRYVCGNQFRIDNRNVIAATVTYKVLNSSPLEQKTITLPARVGDGGSYSTTIITTLQKGTVSLYYDNKQIASSTNNGVPCTPTPTPTPGPNPGKWGAVSAWPFVGIHLALLPTAKVLAWGHYGGPSLWDPTTGTFKSVPSSTLIFCAGHSFLTDGSLFVAGGHIDDRRGLPDANRFDPVTETWKPAAAMSRGRWYPTATTLGNGEVFTIAGTDQNTDTVPTPEVYQTGGTWRLLSSISVRLPTYPRTFLAPNGKVFYAGERQATRYINPAGTGTWEPVLASRNVADRRYGSAVMYAPGKILYVGGGDPPTSSAEIIDLNAAAPAWTPTKPMAIARRQLNATLLADGKVLVTGGSSGLGWSNEAAYVRSAELWNPATGSWTTLALSAAAIPRAYHSAAVLLPDGRVLLAGNGDASGQTDQKSAQIYSPPYLFNSDGSAATRPTITGAPTTVPYNLPFTVQTPSPTTISSVTLVRLGAVTHAFDENQRFLRLAFQQATGGLTVSAPANSNLAPPGHYLLFVLNAGGVPSQARIIQLK